MGSYSFVYGGKGGSHREQAGQSHCYVWTSITRRYIELHRFLLLTSPTLKPCTIRSEALFVYDMI